MEKPYPPTCSQNVKCIAHKMHVRTHIEYASEVWNSNAMKCIRKIEQILRNSCKFIFQDCRIDTGTALLINWLIFGFLHASKLIQRATMFCKILHHLVDICPPSYIQHANHVLSRTDQPLMHCSKNTSQINAYRYSFFLHSMNIWNRLSFSAVSHVTPSVDNLHKLDIPAIFGNAHTFWCCSHLNFL